MSNRGRGAQEGKPSWRSAVPGALGIVVVIGLMALAGPAWAASATQGAEQLPGVSEYLAMAGLSALIVGIVQILKALKVIPDGSAAQWATVLNVIAYATGIILGVFGVDLMAPGSQQVIGILQQVVALALMIVASPLLFRVLRYFGVMGRTDNPF